MYAFFPLHAGAILDDRYELIEAPDSNKTGHTHLLGRGGCGAVYLAHDLSLNCKVAVKQANHLTEESLTIFRREAQFLANLSHPALPKVSRFFGDEKNCFIVMDLIEGDNLQERVEKHGPLPPVEVREIALQLFEVLEYLHGQSVIHKDIKPANLKFTAGGQLKLLDFGFAKGSTGLMSEHQETVIRGLTEAYAPPEQLNSKPTTPQSDLYSAAATLYYLLCGSPPPDGHTRAKEFAIYKIDSLSRWDKVKNSRVPEWFAELIYEGLALAAENRPASATAMKERLLKYTWIDRDLVLPEDTAEIKYFKQGNNCCHIEDFEGAIKNFNQAIELNVNYAEAYYKRAQAYFAKNNFYLGIFTEEKNHKVRNNLNQVIRDSSKAIELKPDLAKAYALRGRAYINKKQFQNCINDCNKAIELQPNLAEAYRFRGLAFLVSSAGIIKHKNSYLNKALTDFDKAIELKPEFAEAYCNRGSLYQEKSDYNQAVNDCTRSIKLSRTDESYFSFFVRGITYFKKGNLAQALSDYNKAIELKPDFLFAFYERAEVFKKLGEKLKAKADRHQASEYIRLIYKCYIIGKIIQINIFLSLILIFLSLYNIGSWRNEASLAAAMIYLVFVFSKQFHKFFRTTSLLVVAIFFTIFLGFFYLLVLI